MLQDAAASFLVMIGASFAGFGGVVPSAAVSLKTLAVIALVLFFVALFRLLYEADVSPSTDS